MNHRSIAQTVALVFGVIYLAVGVAGFLPFLGGTASQTSSNLLGLVPINLLHNLVHLLIGIAGVAAATSMVRARVFNQTVGGVLVALGLVGLVVSNPLGVIPIGGFDIVIHFLTGAVLLYFGFTIPVAVRRAA
jgi:hypothetical protein